MISIVSTSYKIYLTLLFQLKKFKQPEKVQTLNADEKDDPTDKESMYANKAPYLKFCKQKIAQFNKYIYNHSTQVINYSYNTIMICLYEYSTTNKLL